MDNRVHARSLCPGKKLTVKLAVWLVPKRTTANDYERVSPENVR
jgi:hypothetical protein